MMMMDGEVKMDMGRRFSLILRAMPKASYRIFAFAGSKACGRCACLERKSYKDLFRSDSYWHAASLAMAHEKKLFVPNHSTDWREVFAEHIYPARLKWEYKAESSTQDFKIRVSARFRPRDCSTKSSKSFFVPLHQRIRLRRLHKKNISRADIWKQDTTKDEMSRLFEHGQKLSPEVMEALAAAGELTGIASRARTKSNDLPSWNEDNKLDESSTTTTTTTAARTTRFDRSSLSSQQHSSHDDGDNDDHDTNDTKRVLPVDEDIEPNPHIARKRDCRVIAVVPNHACCALYVPGLGLRPFHFANVFSESSDQQIVYNRVAENSVIASLNGFNSCLLCYGQTGSGKTYTMFGPTEEEEKEKFYFYKVMENGGIVLRACQQLIEAKDSIRGVSIHLSMEYCQIYQNKITCLLSGNMVRLRKARGAHLEGTKCVEMTNLDQVLELLKEGEKRKRYASTAMNMHSSRAHTVMKINLTQRRCDTGSFVESTLMLVDLAGSEQVKQSRVQGSQFDEAVGINFSLHILGKCIDSLVKGKRHVPFYESTLTTLLKEGLGGSSRTQAIMTCRSDDAWAEQSLSTLRFGERCSTITNSARLGAYSVKDALITIQRSLSQCETQLEKMRLKGTTHLPLYKKLEERHFTLKRRLDSIALVRDN